MSEYTQAVDHEKEVCEELVESLKIILSNALTDDAHWYRVLGITVYHVVDICRQRRNAETAEVAAIATYALCLSSFETLDPEKLKSFSEQFNFAVDAPPEIVGNEDNAAGIILSACQEIFSDLVGMKFSQRQTRH